VRAVRRGKRIVGRFYARARRATIRRPESRQPRPPRPDRRNVPLPNAVLRTEAETRAATAEIARLGLPSHPDQVKNWDTLAALGVLLDSTRPSDRILDAGAADYSTLLPILATYRYKHLYGCNLEFDEPRQRGPVEFRYGDLTATDYPGSAFGSITCLSVIEHGVDLSAYFKEMARLLRPGGLLVTSTDYWSEPIDTTGLVAYGSQVHVFTSTEITAGLEIAKSYGLELTGPLELSCKDRVVTWPRFGLRYTFVVFTLRKVDVGRSASRISSPWSPGRANSRSKP
jgi:SAM-dependent methyltransferase